MNLLGFWTICWTKQDIWMDHIHHHIMSCSMYYHSRLHKVAKIIHLRINVLGLGNQGFYFLFLQISLKITYILRSLTRDNIDLNRVPQVIQEASCHTSHSCRGLDSAFGLETIPVSLRMPVLKKNPGCFPTASHSLEFEIITVACLCAISRHS